MAEPTKTSRVRKPTLGGGSRPMLVGASGGSDGRFPWGEWHLM